MDHVFVIYEPKNEILEQGIHKFNFDLKLPHGDFPSNFNF